MFHTGFICTDKPINLEKVSYTWWWIYTVPFTLHLMSLMEGRDVILLCAIRV